VEDARLEDLKVTFELKTQRKEKGKKTWSDMQHFPKVGHAPQFHSVLK
jgi:hypothetical protein